MTGNAIEQIPVHDLCSNPMNQSCQMKSDLVAAQQQAADAYARAVTDLARQISVASRREYELLNQVAEMARKRSEQAHTDLENHIAIHGCDPV